MYMTRGQMSLKFIYATAAYDYLWQWVNKINKMLGNSTCYAFLKDLKECTKHSECEWP